MQWLIDLIAGLVALLAAAALAQFGLDADSARNPDREIHRVECNGAGLLAGAAEPRRDC